MIFRLIALCIISCILLEKCHSSTSNQEKKIYDEFTERNKKIKEIAYLNLNERNYENAKLYLDTLIMMDSSNAEYYFKRAYAKSLFLNMDLESTLKDFNKALELNYRNKQSIFLNVGVIYTSIGKFDSALLYLNKCLVIDPLNPTANKMRNEILNQLKNNRRKNIF